MKMIRLEYDPGIGHSYMEECAVDASGGVAQVAEAIVHAMAALLVRIDTPLPPAFKKPTCRGSIQLGSACGHCERCTWERELIRTSLIAGTQAARHQSNCGGDPMLGTACGVCERCVGSGRTRAAS